ncbi:TrkA family potassium uptake protein [bacterium]|nr:TrkA family potassium uptake protein [bacterium]
MGRFGQSLAQKLLELGHTVLAVDSDAHLVQELSDQIPDIVVLNATEESALREVGAEYFGTAVVAIGDDFESNILVTALLKDLGIPQVWCKALSHRQRQILIKVGADKVVLPEHEAGIRLATELSNAGRVLERLELQAGVSVSEVACPAGLLGRSLAQLDLRRALGLTVVAIKGGRSLSLPAPDEVLLGGDRLVVIGNDCDVAKLETWKG